MEKHDEDPGLDAEDCEQGDRPACQTAFAEEPQVEQRTALAQFPHDEPGEREPSDHQGDESHRLGPPLHGSLMDGEAEAQHGDDAGEGPAGVESVLMEAFPWAGGPSLSG